MEFKKDQSIETIRGISIILVIAGHVIGQKVNEGMKVPQDSIWHYFYYTLVLVRMPLFTVISGYVYSLRPVVNGKGFVFLKNKARRILFPMIFAGILHFALQALVPGVNRPAKIEDMWKVPFFSYEHFWFLQSIFIVFIIQTFLDTLSLMDKIYKWLIIIFISSLLLMLMPKSIIFFSISGAFYLFPFFILGCGINRFKLDKNFNFLIISIFLLIPGIILHQLNWYGILSINVERNSLLGLVIGFSATFLLLYVKKNIQILSRLGYYAFGIYLFHVFGSASSRILLKSFGISNLFLIFIFGLSFGVCVPIMIEFIMGKNKLFRKLFLGKN